VYSAVFDGTVAWLSDALFACFADHVGMTSKSLVLRLWASETSGVLSSQIPHWDALSARTNAGFWIQAVGAAETPASAGAVYP
jgi:hypothetical protein